MPASTADSDVPIDEAQASNEAVGADWPPAPPAPNQTPGHVGTPIP